MKNMEATGISRRSFAIGGLSTGAALLAPGKLFGEGVQPGSSKTNFTEPPAGQLGTNTSFASMKQIDAGVLNVGYAEDGPPNGPPRHPSAGMAIRHLQLRRCCSAAGRERLQGDRPVSARLWLYALSFEANLSQWPAIRGGPRHHRI